MSLDRSIQHKKDHRKPYYDSKRFDPTCRPNGRCSYCRNNRLFSSKKEGFRAREAIEEYFWDNTGENYEEALDLDVEKAIFGEE